MSHHESSPGPDLAHTLVAADPARLEALAARYGAMTDSHVESGPSSLAAEAAWRALLALLDGWRADDHAASLRDMVELSSADEARVVAAARSLLDAVKWLEPEEQAEIVPILERARSGVGRLPRIWARLAVRSSARAGRLLRVDAPAFTLGTEARILSRALDGWQAPPPLSGDTVEWHRAGSLLYDGLMLSLTTDDNDEHPDVGLGVSPAVLPIVGVRQWALERLEQYSFADGSCPSLEAQLSAVAEPTLVPPGRFHSHGPGVLAVRDHFEGTGPIGWATGPQLDRFVEQFVGLRSLRPRWAAELRAAKARLQAVAAAGQGVVGLLELLDAESEGQRAIFHVSAGDPSG